MFAAYQHKIKPFFYACAMLASLIMPTYTYAADVIVTLPPLAGLVKLLDTKANMQCLLAKNADPHHVQLSPHQVETLQHATLLLRSSQDDGFWSGLTTNAVNTVDLWPLHNQRTHPNHAWLNPKEVNLILPVLAKALMKANPEHHKYIEHNLIQAQKKAQDIWHRWQQAQVIRSMRKYGVMLQHPSWNNIFLALNVPVLNILESEQHGHEYGPRKLEKALKQLSENPQALLIADNNHSNRALQWLQKHHASSVIISLNALGDCGQSWDSLMQENLKTLQTHITLKKEAAP